MDAEVEAYFDALPAGRRERLRCLHDLIMGLYPAASCDMRYRMPTYAWSEGWVAIANQKHHISLYTCSAAHLAAFKTRHPKIRTGKGCINFRDRDVLPVPDIEAVVRHAISQPKGSRS